MQILRLSSVGSKFAKFRTSFFKVKISSSSNFASFLTVMTHNSSVFLWFKHTYKKSSASKCDFSELPMLALKFTNFLMKCLKPKVSLSSNFASLFGAMRDSSSVLFLPKLYMIWTRGAHQSATF